MKPIHPILFFIFFLSMTQCNPIKHISQISENKKLLSYERTACYGFCPVYSVILLQNGQVFFIGKQFIPIKDTITFQLPDQQLKQIKQIMEHPEYRNMKIDTTDLQVFDIPKLKYTDFIHDQKYDLDIHIPAPITEITKRIDHILKQKQLLYDDPEYPPGPVEIIISLVPGTDPASVTNSFKGLDLSYIKEIGNDIHLYSIITSESFLSQALEQLKKHESIQEVQKNHSLDRRDKN